MKPYYYMRIQGDMLGKINAPPLTRVTYYPVACSVIIKGLATGEADIKFCQWASKTGKYAKRSFDDFEIEIVNFQRTITIKQAEILYYDSMFGQTEGRFSMVIRSKDREAYENNRYGDHHFISAAEKSRLNLVVILPRDGHCRFQADDKQWLFRIIRDNVPDITGALEIDMDKLSEIMGQRHLYQKIGKILVRGLNFVETTAKKDWQAISDLKLKDCPLPLQYDICHNMMVGAGLKVRYNLTSKPILAGVPTGMNGEMEFILKPKTQPLTDEELEEIWADLQPVKTLATTTPLVETPATLSRVRFATANNVATATPVSWMDSLFPQPKVRILTIKTVDGVALHYVAKTTDPKSIAQLNNAFEFAQEYNLTATITEVSDNNLTLKNGVRIGSYGRYIGKQITTDAMEYLFGREVDKILDIKYDALKGLAAISSRLTRIVDKCNGVKELMKKHGWNERAYELWTISLGITAPIGSSSRNRFRGYLIVDENGDATYKNLVNSGEAISTNVAILNTYSYVLQRMINFGTDYIFLLLP